jgi:hypothetical protein
MKTIYLIECAHNYEASRSAGQEIPCLLWICKVHYHVHKIPSAIPVLKEINLVHTLEYWVFNSLISTIFSDTVSITHSFNPGSGQVGFVVDKVAPGLVFSEYFGFP